jgi:hypothetical protein
MTSELYDIDVGIKQLRVDNHHRHDQATLNPRLNQGRRVVVGRLGGVVFLVVCGKININIIINLLRCNPRRPRHATSRVSC